MNLDERISVTLMIRAGLAEHAAERLARIDAQRPHEREHVTHDWIAQHYTSSADDLAAVISWLENSGVAGISIADTDPEAHTVTVEGSLASFAELFHIEFFIDGDTYGETAPPRIPDDLKGIVLAVFGLRNTRAAAPHALSPYTPPKRHTPGTLMVLEVTPEQIAEFYGFPKGATGKGQQVAIITLGGGYREEDLAAHFREHNRQAPSWKFVGVKGATNDPASPEAVAAFWDKLKQGGAPDAGDEQAIWTVESTMDVELVGTFAPGASIVVYGTKNTTDGIRAAFKAAIADPATTVISCSWGFDEIENQKPVTAIDATLFAKAKALGITIVASSGDDPSSTTPFPACSPNVLSCGGTTVSVSPRKETAWLDTKFHMGTGGGFSKTFSLPGWQQSALEAWAGQQKTQVPTGRAVPDVAAKADLENGFTVIIGDLKVPVGGTSAAVPLWAALIALANEGLSTANSAARRLGLITAALYGDRAFHGATRDITAGNNGKFKAGPGWDPCTGLGSPRATDFIRAVSSARGAAAG